MNKQRAFIANNVAASYEDEGAIFLKSEDNLEICKGRKGEPLGAKKTWGGKEYMKTANGWKPVGKAGGAAKAAHDFVHGEKKGELSEVAQELYDKTMDLYKNNPSKQAYYLEKLNEIVAPDSKFDADHKAAATKMLAKVGHKKTNPKGEKDHYEKWNEANGEKKYHDMGNGMKIEIQKPGEGENTKASIRGAFDMTNAPDRKKLISHLGLSEGSAMQTYDKLSESDKKKVYDHFAAKGHHDSDAARTKEAEVKPEANTGSSELSVGSTWHNTTTGHKETIESIDKDGWATVQVVGKPATSEWRYPEKVSEVNKFIKRGAFNIQKSDDTPEFQKAAAERILSCYGTLGEISKGIDYKSAIEMMKEQRDPDNIEIEKGGEGSKGGKVIGHTKSGKPIYAEKHAKEYSDFNDADHKDAEKEHHKIFLQASEKHGGWRTNNKTANSPEYIQAHHHRTMGMGHAKMTAE